MKTKTAQKVNSYLKSPDKNLAGAACLRQNSSAQAPQEPRSREEFPRWEPAAVLSASLLLAATHLLSGCECRQTQDVPDSHLEFTRGLPQVSKGSHAEPSRCVPGSAGRGRTYLSMVLGSTERAKLACEGRLGAQEALSEASSFQGPGHGHLEA